MTRRLPLHTRRTLLGLVGASLLCPAPGAASQPSSIGGMAFGTAWRILGDRPEALQRLGPRIEALFRGIDAQMSPWRPDSALSRFNAGRAGWTPVAPALAGLTARTLSLARVSGGAFDPTVGPLVARWGFGPIAGGPPDWRDLATGTGRIGKARDDLTLDLCGIAKGWALDRAADLAVAEGLTDLLLDLGGEFRALGRHPSGRPWHVAVEPPVGADTPPMVLALRPGMAVATSGLQAQSYAIRGRTYGHIIDPGAQAPAGDGLHSVTVLARDAATADGWATALFAAGNRSGPALARAQGIDALFVGKDGVRPAHVRTGAIADVML